MLEATSGVYFVGLAALVTAGGAAFISVKCARVASVIERHLKQESQYTTLDGFAKIVGHCSGALLEQFSEEMLAQITSGSIREPGTVVEAFDGLIGNVVDEAVELMKRQGVDPEEKLGADMLRAIVNNALRSRIPLTVENYAKALFDYVQHQQLHAEEDDRGEEQETPL